MSVKRVLAGAATVLLVSAAAASLVLGGGAADEYTRIDGAGEPLRSTFNADVGNVRVLMLVAPT